jgi:hypothetical protein
MIEVVHSANILLPDESLCDARCALLLERPEKWRRRVLEHLDF